MDNVLPFKKIEKQLSLKLVNDTATGYLTNKHETIIFVGSCHLGLIGIDLPDKTLFFPTMSVGNFF